VTVSYLSFSRASMAQWKTRVSTEIERRKASRSISLHAYANDPVAFVEEAALALFTQFKRSLKSQPLRLWNSAAP